MVRCIGARWQYRTSAICFVYAKVGPILQAKKTNVFECFRRTQTQVSGNIKRPQRGSSFGLTSVRHLSQGHDDPVTTGSACRLCDHLINNRAVCLHGRAVCAPSPGRPLEGGGTSCSTETDQYVYIGCPGCLVCVASVALRVPGSCCL